MPGILCMLTTLRRIIGYIELRTVVLRETAKAETRMDAEEAM